MAQDEIARATTTSKTAAGLETECCSFILSLLCCQHLPLSIVAKNERLDSREWNPGAVDGVFGGDTESVGGRPLDDAELVQRARRGDVRAYEELVQRYQAIAQRTAYLIAGSTSEAEDAVQEAFVKAYYALDRFRHEAPFRPWLLKIVANEARNRLRKAGRQAGLVLRASEVRPSGDAAPSPEAAALELEQQQALVAAMNELREKDRTALGLRFFMDLSEEEMAAAMGCAKGTVKSRVSRALDRLRKQLKERDVGDLLSDRRTDK